MKKKQKKLIKILLLPYLSLIIIINIIVFLCVEIIKYFYFLFTLSTFLFYNNIIIEIKKNSN